jgi:hypothetical protein
MALSIDMKIQRQLSGDLNLKSCFRARWMSFGNSHVVGGGNFNAIKHKKNQYWIEKQKKNPSKYLQAPNWRIFHRIPVYKELTHAKAICDFIILPPATICSSIFIY